MTDPTIKLALAMALAVTALGFTAMQALAETATIPAPYHGTWCDENEEEPAGTYRRCREVMTEADMIISARSIETAESRCDVTSVKPFPGGHRIETSCRAEGIDVWTVRERWIIVNRKLVVKNIDD